MKNTALILVACLSLLTACKTKTDITYNFPPKPIKSTSTSDLAQLFAANGPKSEKHPLNASTGGTIVSSKGTTYYMSPDIFMHQDGSPVTGQVDIVIKEIKDPSEMILADKPTMTNQGKMLESYGEFKVDAFQGNSTLVLKPQAVIQAAAKAVPSKDSSRFIPMWNGDTTVNSTVSGRDFENGSVTSTVVLNVKKGIDWSQASDVASGAGSTLNFVIDKLGTWRNCDGLIVQSTPTTVIGYFSNVFNDSSLTSQYMEIDPNLLFFKKKGSNTLIKLYNQIIDPPSAKSGFLSYVNTFDIGMEGTFLAIVNKDGKFYACVKDVTIGTPAVGKSFWGIDFVLNEVSEAQLLILIASMNSK